jgi:hypothetical protein
MAIPKFSLVSPEMIAMIRPHPRILEEIEEEDEDARSEARSGADARSTATTEGKKVHAKVDMAISHGHGALKRSSFVANLAALLPDASDSDPATPERSHPSPPTMRPTSNTPNTMLRKKVEFSLPPLMEGWSPAEELVGTRGVGAIFMDDEDEAADGSSIVLGSPVSTDGAVYWEPHFISHSFAAMGEAGTESDSAYSFDDDFTAPSTETTTPTTVAGSDEGLPSPSVTAQRARCLTLTEQRWPEDPVRGLPETPVHEQLHTHKRKSGWASIKTSLGRKPTHGYTTAAANVEFMRSQRRTSSWTKVENKLQKPAQLANATAEKKKGGLRKALKKTKDSLVHGFHTLAERGVALWVTS